MADFISREKEFRAINEQLDDDFKRSTHNTSKKFNERSGTRHTPVNSRANGSQKPNINNDRFLTFTKSKAVHGSSWLKKSGGGDFISPPKSPPISNSRKDNYNNTNTNSGKDGPKSSITTSPKQRRIRASEEPFHGTTTVIHTYDPRSVQQFPSEDGAIMVKYHNNKFSTSPSLDNLIKQSIGSMEENDEYEEITNLLSEATDNARRKPLSPKLIETHNIDGKNIKKLVNTNSLIRYLKSKIALLEENQVKSIQDMAEQKEAFEEINERLKLTKQQRDKALAKNTALSEQLEKLTNQLNETNRRTRERSQEYMDKHQELESVKRELKHLSLAHRTLESRFARAQEDLETALKSKEDLKIIERELKDKLLHHTDAKDAEIKCLKKQRSDLFAAYKKQLYLIDNLRQQNLCMEQAKMIDFSEKEFSKILEWNLKP